MTSKPSPEAQAAFVRALEIYLGYIRLHRAVCQSAQDDPRMEGVTVTDADRIHGDVYLRTRRARKVWLETYRSDTEDGS